MGVPECSLGKYLMFEIRDPGGLNKGSSGHILKLQCLQGTYYVQHALADTPTHIYQAVLRDKAPYASHA